MPAQARKPTNLTLDPDLLAQARALGIEVRRAAEAVRAATAEAWKRDNAEALGGFRQI
jgi:antitoxin CcdA